jgi:type IV pilus assembly protein PilB
MLVAQGIISPEQLAEALELQRTEKQARIGRLLVDLGYVTELQIADVVADQMRLPSIDLSTIQISPDAVGKVPRELAVKHRCLPWKLEGRDLHLVTADPTDVSALDAIGFATGLRVRPIVAAESEVIAAIERHFPGEEANPEIQFDNVELADQLKVIDEDDADAAGTSDEDLQKAAHAGPVIRLVNSILADAIQGGASDIHIEPQQKGVNLRYRIDGALRQVITMPKRSQAKIVSRIKIAAHMDIAERRKPQDGRSRMVLGGRAYDMRVSTLPTADGEKVVIRILEQARAKVALQELGFDDDVLAAFKDVLSRPQGMILVTGPTGSGKTSTLYAALNFLASETTNIVTVEDPVEYRLPGVNQVAVSDRAGLTFATGLRSILRQDPNVVMVGEIRDLETAQIAFQASQTGHLVLSTLHTNDAPSAVSRLVEMGVPGYLVASSVIAVQAQRLVRRLCQCREMLPDGTAVPKGCEACRHTGFKGRMAVHELLRLTPRVREAVVNHASTDALRRLARQAGMHTMFEDGLRKIVKGTTTMDELLRVVPPPEEDDTVAAGVAAEAPAGPPAAPADALPVPVFGVMPMMPSSPVPLGSRRPRVLVMDGDAAAAQATQRLLSEGSYDVTVAATPRDALASAFRDAPDVVLLEVRGMPGMDGFDLLRRLRSNLATYRTAVIFVTAVDDPRAEVAALDAGADDYLRKPVDDALLMSRIRRALLRSYPLSA